MRKSLILFAVAASLCMSGYAQTPGDGSSANSQQADAASSDAQPTNAPAPQVSLGDYARQLRLKKQQREAQQQQAKESQAKDSQAKESPAKEIQAPQSPEQQSSAPTAQAAEVKPASQPSLPSPEPQTATAVPHIEQTPAVTQSPQPKPQIVTTAAVPARATVSPAAVHQTVSPSPQSIPVPTEAQVRQWKAEIQQQKTLVASMQKDIVELSNSIHFAGENCIANCDQWNDRQKQKKQDLDTLKTELLEQQDILAQMLEAEKVLIPPSARNSQ